MASTVSVLEIYYGAKGLRKTGMTDFGKFAGELAEELGKRDSPQARERQSAGDSVPLWSCCLRFQVGIRATFCFDVCFSSHPWSAFARVFYVGTLSVECAGMLEGSPWVRWHRHNTSCKSGCGSG